MNSKLAITAIVMFAVIMGLGVMSPAMAAPGNPNSKATTEVCHLFEAVEDNPDTQEDETELAHWGVLHTNNKGATNGHVNGHGDSLIGGNTDPDADPPTITLDDCIAQEIPEPVLETEV